ncbi:MAG: hypothetical protein HYW28_07390 [Rhodospirillales bacterium]|nr:hypothetical protein [Rhodospirillales bacterium]
MDTTDQDGKAKKKSSGLFSGFNFGGDDAPATDSRFEITINDLPRKFNAAVISRMQILNLNSLIVRRDVDRNEMIKKAEVIALGVIEDNFQDKDAFIHNDVGVYGFLFPGMSKKSAELKCKVIADQIARLINDADPQILNLEFEATTQKRRSGKFSDVVAGRKNKKESARGTTSLDPRKLRELENKKTLANLAIQRMTAQSRNDAHGSEAEMATWWVDDNAARPGEKGLPEGMTTIFRAIWNVRSKMLTAYSALPVLKSPDGHVESIVRVGGESEMYAAAAACDLLVQEEALRKLYLLLDAGHKVLLVLPVHFSTVNHFDYYMPYQQRIRKLDEKQRLLVVQELVGTPPDLNSYRIRETVTRLRKAARSVMARVSPAASSLRVWREAGVHAVGFEFTEGQASERALLKRLDRFAERAEEAGLKKFVYGLATRSAASAAVAAGFDYIEGTVVRGPVESPAYVEPFESLDLFAGLFSR